MKFEPIHVMVAGEIASQSAVVGVEHLLRVVGIDPSCRRAAGVKRQRRARRDTNIAYPQEHCAGGWTMGVDTKAFTRRIISPRHRLEFRKRLWTGRSVAHPYR